jgi:purine-nucleoside phosphorylase
MTPFEQFEAATRRFAPRVAVVLGSGLGPVVDQLRTVASIDFTSVPGFAAPTVQGHSGKVHAVEWGGVPALAFRGRMHYYEGHPWERVVGTVNLAARLGIKSILLTNAAGGIHPDLHPGDLMVIRNHLSLLDANAWKVVAESKPITNPYSPNLVTKLQSLSPTKLLAGVYAGLTGPTYETPAEIRALKAMGADAVGMSTVMEANAAAEQGLQVAAISCITNKAAGLSDAKLDHNEVQDVASRADVVGRLAKLMEAFLADISSESR